MGGNSSVVEHRLAKARVEGSNPFSRSSLLSQANIYWAHQRRPIAVQKQIESAFAQTEPAYLLRRLSSVTAVQVC